jgi:hypothetical protein
MTEGSPYPSFYVPDAGAPYLPGDVVRIDRSSGQPRIIKDECGEYEVLSSRGAPELGADPPMLRINLHRIRD